MYCTQTPLTDDMLPDKFWQKEPEERSKKGVIALHVAPNPAREKIIISMVATDDTNGLLRLTNVTGKEVYRQKQGLIKGLSTVEINSAAWPSGIYFVVLNADGKPYSCMVVVE